MNILHPHTISLAHAAHHTTAPASSRTNTIPTFSWLHPAIKFALGAALLAAMALPRPAAALMECISCSKEYTQLGLLNEQLRQGVEQTKQGAELTQQGREQIVQSHKLQEQTEELIKHTKKMSEMYDNMEANTKIHDEPIGRSEIQSHLKAIQGILANGQTLASKNAALEFSGPLSGAEYKNRFHDYAKGFDATNSPVPKDYADWSRTMRETVAAILDASDLRYQHFQNEELFMSKLEQMANSPSGRNQMLQVASTVTMEIVGQLQKLREMQSAQLLALSTDMAIRQQNEDMKNFGRKAVIPTASAKETKTASYQPIQVSSSPFKFNIDPTTGKVNLETGGQKIEIDGAKGNVKLGVGGQNIAVDGSKGTVSTELGGGGQKVSVKTTPDSLGLGLDVAGVPVSMSTNSKGITEVNAAGQKVSANPVTGIVDVNAGGQQVKVDGKQGTVQTTAGGQQVNVNGKTGAVGMGLQGASAPVSPAAVTTAATAVPSTSASAPTPAPASSASGTQPAATSSGTATSSATRSVTPDLAATRSEIASRTGIRLPVSYGGQPLSAADLTQRIDQASQIVSNIGRGNIVPLENTAVSDIQSRTGVQLPDLVNGTRIDTRVALSLLSESRSMLSTAMNLAQARPDAIFLAGL